jgi:hypothetical protein
MKLLVDWSMKSPRLDRLLAAGCSHCDSPVGRLVRHNAGPGGQQIWLSCTNYCARLGGQLPLARVVLAGARRCRLCHFSIEDAIDPALSAICCDRAPN